MTIEPRFRVSDIGFSALYLVTDNKIINRSYKFADIIAEGYGKDKIRGEGGGGKKLAILYVAIVEVI
jgi:hypothetical protein